MKNKIHQLKNPTPISQIICTAHEYVRASARGHHDVTIDVRCCCFPFLVFSLPHGRMSLRSYAINLIIFGLFGYNTYAIDKTEAQTSTPRDRTIYFQVIIHSITHSPHIFKHRSIHSFTWAPPNKITHQNFVHRNIFQSQRTNGQKTASCFFSRDCATYQGHSWSNRFEWNRKIKKTLRAFSRCQLFMQFVVQQQQYLQGDSQAYRV